jgi:ribonuclease-3
MSDLPLENLEKNLGYQFKNKELLVLALTHPSKAYEAKSNIPTNQRLEFLGDAVLQLVMTGHLYHNFSDQDEGELTKMRAKLVNRHALESLAINFGIHDHLILGRGEELNQGRQRTSNLADAMEAIIGAIFLDAGFEAVQYWVKQMLWELMEDMLEASLQYNPKGQLQELLQQKGPEVPEYEPLRDLGPAHDKIYEVVVRWKGKDLGQGKGSSKKQAEMEAAKQALLNLSKKQ